MSVLSVVSEEKAALIKSIRRRYDAVLDTFPTALHSDFIRPYTNDDFNSPGLLSLVGLPFWLGEKWDVEHQICQDMAVGNLFLLHCFQSFDFVVDRDRPGTSTRSQIVLGNLCYLQVVRHYGPYFPADSPFWERMEGYWQEWGESILWEVEKGETRRPFSDAFLQLAAHKAAALKICPTGLALLSGQPDLIPNLEQAVDLMHASMQLVDDLKDWREDLEHHRYNSFLGMLAADQRFVPDQLLKPEDVAAAISDSNILQRYVKTIREYARRAEAVIDELGFEPWSRLVRGLVEEAAGMDQHYHRWLESFLLERLTPIK
jgi:hypothetical protein